MKELRKRAEDILLLNPTEFNGKIDDIKKIIHDIQVYQIELELQNQELQKYSDEIKNAELKFHTLFNFSPVAFFLSNKQGIIKECNYKALELLDSVKEKVINKPLISSVAEGKMDDFFTFLNDVSESKNLYSDKFSFYGKKRIVIPVEIFAQQISNQDVVFAVIDITDKKNNDAKLKSALEKAEESNKLKSDFLKMISHEIRTPLNAVVGFSNLLQKEDLSIQKKQSFAERISSGGTRLLSLIEDLLLVSSPDDYSENIKENIFSINIFFDELKLLFEKKFKENKNIFVFKFLENDIFIKTDKEKLSDICNRLIDNSTKFTNNGVIEISVSKNNNKIIFCIKDSGIGIDAETQKKLFKPFSKVEDNKNFHNGLGLGLTIAKIYCELLSGQIWFMPGKDGGSEFYFEFPYSEEKLVPETVVNRIQKTESRKKTVLIADDEIMNFELLAEILSGFDIDILHAENGKEAVKLNNENNVDLILMDLKMPEMDGITATSIIRETNKIIPILAVTAYIQNDKDIQNLFNVIINKPIDISNTITLLNQYLNG